MDLRKLQHAALLAETLHFARAAERAHLTQSALSRSIQALEAELGLTLFDRGPGGVALSAAGRQLLERSRPLLRSARDLAHDMRLLREAEIGDLALGAGPFPSATLLPPVLAGLQDSHPGLRIDLQIDHTSALCAMLESERIELFVADTRATALPPGLEVRTIASQQGGLFCRAAHPLARRRRLVVGDIAAQRFASVHLPPGVRESLRRMLKLPREVNWSLTCDNVYLLKDLARRADVVLVATEQVLAQEIAAGEFVPLRPAGIPAWPVSVGVVSLQGRSPSPAAELLTNRLAQAAAPAP